MKKLTLITAITINFFLLTTNLFSQPCLPEGITFNTQAEIDSFQINYPNCTEIEGDVEINGEGITHINGLNVLTYIGGDLGIFETELINLTGLNNITYIDGNLILGHHWNGNPSLTSLSGLENLNSIGGSLRLEDNNTLTSLTGLNNLTSIGEDLVFSNNDALASLTGLENLTSIGGIHISGNDTLISLTGLEGLTAIIGSVSIGTISNNPWFWGIGNELLTNLNGLNNVSTIGGDFSIICNNSMASLTGLENLTSIGGDLSIGRLEWYNCFGNPSLTSLTGLEGLSSVGGELGIYCNDTLSSLMGINNVTSIGGGLSIINNSALISLSGMDNINAASIEDLSIYDNITLSTCEIESVCNYLAAPNGIVNIYNNASGCNNPGEVANACGITLPCLPHGNYYFFSQSEIDDFQTNYPGCTQLLGNVKISANDITDLNGLNVVTTIVGNLYIRENALLIDLTGLENLTFIGEGLNVVDNNTLITLNGIDNLSSIGEVLNIYQNNSLTSLMGLNNVSGIGESLIIRENNVLNSLSGLNNIEASSITDLYVRYNAELSTCEVQSICNYLASPNGNIYIDGNAPGCNSPVEVEEFCFYSCLSGGISFYSQLDIDSFQYNYPNCVKINGDVTISGDDIVNLNGLTGLKSIDGNLEITENDLLTSLLGLNNIVRLNGNLWITDNDALTSLSGINNISSIGGSFHIEGNATITNLWGLENIYPGSVNELNIFNNTSLIECDVQSVCEYIASPGATVQIYNNAAGCNSLEEIEDACEYHCLYEGITFNTQAEIDSFQYNYPLCSEIDGDVKIIGNDISNLNGLSVVTFIGGNLEISGNSSLVSLVGLSNLVYFQGALEIYDNDALLDLTGLDNLELVGSLFIDKNDLLSNLTGLENLTYINNGLTIGTFSAGGGNPTLSDLSGLSNLYSIEGGLYIKYNPELTSLTGIDNLSEIDGALEIKANGSLTNIADLSNINPGSINSLMLTLNQSLSDCTAESICSYLAGSNTNVLIENNAPGCNSPEEIQDSCLITSIEEISCEQTFTIYPNPLESSATISYTLYLSSPVTLKILDLSGREIVTLVNEVHQFGEQRIEFNTTSLPAGIYFCTLKTNEGIQITKLIKL